MRPANECKAGTTPRRRREVRRGAKASRYDFAQDMKKLTGQQVFEMFAGGREN